MTRINNSILQNKDLIKHISKYYIADREILFLLLSFRNTTKVKYNREITLLIKKHAKKELTNL